MKMPKSNGLNKREISLSFISKPRGMWYRSCEDQPPSSSWPYQTEVEIWSLGSKMAARVPAVTSDF